METKFKTEIIFRNRIRKRNLKTKSILKWKLFFRNHFEKEFRNQNLKE